MNKITNCWKCSAEYAIDSDKCPECGAANANVDYELASEELKEYFGEEDTDVEAA